MKHKILFYMLLLVMAYTARLAHASQSPEFSQAKSLITNGGFIVTKGGHILSQFAPKTAFIPASTWKIATASLALHTLGNHYHFKTIFYQNSSGQLFIQGFGDPFLTSEQVAKLLVNLKMQLRMPVSGIVIDDTAFDLDSRTDGSSLTLNPYDAGLGALAVNFNTINLQVNNDGITSAEEQTPYLPIMSELGRNLKLGKHRIALRSKKNIPIYAGQLFAALGSLQPGASALPIRRGKVPSGLKAIYSSRNDKDLTEVLKALFLYSNNFIANQIFLTCGAQRYGWPATWDKARKAMREFLERTVKLPNGTYKVMEGSGLSRHNMITPTAMLKLLYYFKPQAYLLPVHHHQKMKSGTLTGVYAYAGYLGDIKNPDPFVLILNQANNVREKVVGLLRAGYNSAR